MKKKQQQTKHLLLHKKEIFKLMKIKKKMKKN